mmetsp:Transcript_34154/g.80498  ORF Transcript_34154/g.80498 Transcript_34154/m.80498 type:complete len:211 (-) Transcript_34154:1164-1796(-)
MSSTSLAPLKAGAAGRSAFTPPRFSPRFRSPTPRTPSPTTRATTTCPCLGSTSQRRTLWWWRLTRRLSPRRHSSCARWRGGITRWAWGGTGSAPRPGSTLLTKCWASPPSHSRSTMSSPSAVSSPWARPTLLSTASWEGLARCWPMSPSPTGRCCKTWPRTRTQTGCSHTAATSRAHSTSPQKMGRWFCCATGMSESTCTCARPARRAAT